MFILSDGLVLLQEVTKGERERLRMTPGRHQGDPVILDTVSSQSNPTSRSLTLPLPCTQLRCDVHWPPGSSSGIQTPTSSQGGSSGRFPEAGAFLLCGVKERSLLCLEGEG